MKENDRDTVDPPRPEPEADTLATEGDDGDLGRRDFLRLGASAGLLAAGGYATTGAAEEPAEKPFGAPAIVGQGPDVIVVGAGAWGCWTAYHLIQQGARVTLIDQYGPGNSRATSGGETRGIRSSYRDNELWVEWANRAMERWRTFNAEVADPLGSPVFFQTGDVTLRSDWDPQTRLSRESFEKLGVPHEVLTPDEMRYRWPHINVDGLEVILYEPGAGVGRARRTCEVVADLFEKEGGTILLGKASVGATGTGGRLADLEVSSHGRMSADLFVFALGPWFPTMFPEFMADRLRTPMGYVFYYGVPMGDPRWHHPNMPSYNVPGCTGWPSLQVDSRGFRVRTGGRRPEAPDTSIRYVEPEALERPREILRRYFPELADAPLMETRACHYESTVDRNWLIDHHPDYGNAWLAGGGNAEGFKFSILLGDYIARRVLDNDPYPELAERFSLKDEEFDPSGDRRLEEELL